ncbi:hypothetical protein [Corynebacterium provencense]|uniref:hypothetical protein n=1 Tax=Corynebacterium provencense TaxID=1737425 RepID=UPI00082A1111|nr:hypothetical protein [Corynebacterium provencense]
MTTTAQAKFIEDLRNTDTLTMRDDYQWSVEQIAFEIAGGRIKEYRAAHPGVGRADAREALMADPEIIAAAERIRDEDWAANVTDQTCDLSTLTTSEASALIDRLKISYYPTIHGYGADSMAPGAAAKIRARA